MIDSIQKKQRGIIKISLYLTIQKREHEKKVFADIFIFLINYSFILADASPENNFSKRQFPPPGELFSPNSNGARYLDPKYSRWISVDPALGEYVPAAGKGNSSDAGNLPGMGGIYNSVNGNL